MRILLQLTMMENRKALLLVILQLVCANLELLAALPLTSQSRAEVSMLPGAARLPQERVRRKIGNLDTSTGPMEYMKQLRNNLTHSNGKPKNGEEDPTSVWCILDKGEGRMDETRISRAWHGWTFCVYNCKLMRHIIEPAHTSSAAGTCSDAWVVAGVCKS